MALALTPLRPDLSASLYNSVSDGSCFSYELLIKTVETIPTSQYINSRRI